MMKLITILLTPILALFLVTTISGCPGKLSPTVPKTNTVTTSEIAEAVASGVVNSTYQSGSMARHIPKSPNARALAKLIESYLNPLPRAEAAMTTGLCPTLQSGEDGVLVINASCTIVANAAGAMNVETLTWAPCNMATPYGTWSGGSNFSLVTSPGSTVMTCTGFPPFQAGDVVTRSFFSPSGRINNGNWDPSYLANNIIVPWNPLTQQDLQPPFSSGPVTVLVDTFGATQVPNTTDFRNAVPAGYPTSGYSGYLYQVPTLGETIVYSGAVARQIWVNGLHVKADVAGYITWDFTISTTSPAGVSTPLTVDGTNTVTGTLYVQNNQTFVTTSSALNSLKYTAGCGVPMDAVNAGNVVTTAVSGSFSTETLTFPAGSTCGTGSINGGSNFYLFHSF